MVYGNYDAAYVVPVCDLCGNEVEKSHEYTPFKIETAFPSAGVRTEEHDGHLCNECNELSDHEVLKRAKRIEFHIEAMDPARLLMVDVLGTHRTGGQLHSIQKLHPDECPEFLKELGYGIASCAAGVKSTPLDDDTEDRIQEKYTEANRVAHGRN